MSDVAEQSEHTQWDGDEVHGRHPRTTRVWVRLDAICPRIPGQPHRVEPSGLDMTGEVPGLLSTWLCSAKGDWMGVVTYQIPYADGRRSKLDLRDQLVPSSAIRERADT